MSTLHKLLSRIVPPDPALAARAQAHLDRLTKPPGSLGRLEELARRVGEVTGQEPPRGRGRGGVGAEGVSPYPRVVTAQMLENFLRGGAAVNVLARHAGARVVVADFGVAAALASPPAPGGEKGAPGPQNFCRG